MMNHYNMFYAKDASCLPKISKIFIFQRTLTVAGCFRVLPLLPRAALGEASQQRRLDLHHRRLRIRRVVDRELYHVTRAESDVTECFYIVLSGLAWFNNLDSLKL